MRPKAVDQIPKETALEAYHDAARPYNFKNRPNPGDRGFGAVSAALSCWLGVDFSTVAKTERDATLGTLSLWMRDRRKLPGPRARVDWEFHGRLFAVLRASLSEELGPPPGTRVAVRWEDDVVYEGVVDEILGRARARILFDNGDDWHATFPDATVTVASENHDALASAATPAAAALALGRPDVEAVLAREAAAKPAKPAKPAKKAKKAAEAKPNELATRAVLPRELAIAEARLSERRGVLAASELGEAATLARNFVQNDALQAEPSGEAFLDAVLSRSGLALSAQAREIMAAGRKKSFFKPKEAT